jgi:hypothetical protein
MLGAKEALKRVETASAFSCLVFLRCVQPRLLVLGELKVSWLHLQSTRRLVRRVALVGAHGTHVHRDRKSIAAKWW